MITIETQAITGSYYGRDDSLINKKNHIVKNTIKLFYEPSCETVYFRLPINLSNQNYRQPIISEELAKEFENKNLIIYLEDKNYIILSLYKILLKFIDGTTEELTFYEKDKAYKAYDILLKSFKNGL